MNIEAWDIWNSFALHKNLSFPVRISSINVTKSTLHCGFAHIYWKNPSWKTSFFLFNVIRTSFCRYLCLKYVGKIKTILLWNFYLMWGTPIFFSLNISNQAYKTNNEDNHCFLVQQITTFAISNFLSKTYTLCM